MIRKITLGLTAAASLAAAALAPASASAHGFHGWHHGFGFSGLYINTGLGDCYQERVVQTRTACAHVWSTSAIDLLQNT